MKDRSYFAILPSSAPRVPDPTPAHVTVQSPPFHKATLCIHLLRHVLKHVASTTKPDTSGYLGPQPVSTGFVIVATSFMAWRDFGLFNIFVVSHGTTKFTEVFLVFLRVLRVFVRCPVLLVSHGAPSSQRFFRFSPCSPCLCERF